MKKILSITDLYAGTIDGKKILNGVNLTIRQGEIHAVMGPNGGGKSTLAQVVMGHPGYNITKGKIKLNKTDLTGLPPDQRAKKGLFLGFQYPVEVAGVNFASFLGMAINAGLKKGEKKLSPIAFREHLSDKAHDLAFHDDLTARALNEGFSGGEKKKAEILQLALLKPAFAILDEPDSGLDVDALKYISKAILSLGHKPGIILITHYQRILRYIKPDFIHVMIKGKIIKSGNARLAREIEEQGYQQYYLKSQDTSSKFKSEKAA